MDLYSKKIQKILKIKNFKEISQIKSLENKIMKMLSLKYNSHCKNKNKQFTYNNIILENIILNKNCHIVAVFKDYMILDYIDEFLKRKYSRKESKIRIPNFPYFYKNYLRFFCIPTYSDFYFNYLIQNNNEKKARRFFNENYINKRQSKDSKINEGILIYPNNEDSLNNSCYKILKTFFNESIRKKIEKDSPIRNSIVLNESETKLKNDESGLLISFSNENSLNHLVKELNNKNAPKILDKNSKEKLNNNEDNKFYDISSSPINKIKKNGKELIGQKTFQKSIENNNNNIECILNNNNNKNKEDIHKYITNLIILHKNNSAIDINPSNISKNIYPNSNIIKNIKLINTKKIVKRNNNNYTTCYGLKNNTNKKIQSKSPIIQIIKMKYLNNNFKNKTFNLKRKMSVSNLLLNNNKKDNNTKNDLIIKSRNIQNKKNKENSFQSNSFNINLNKKNKNKNNIFFKSNTRNYLNYKYDSHINLSKIKNNSYFKKSDSHSIIKKSKEKDSIPKAYLSSINFYKKNKKNKDNSRSFKNRKNNKIISDKVIFNKKKNKSKGNSDSKNSKKTFCLLKKNINSIKNIENEYLYKTLNILKKNIPINNNINYIIKNLNENNNYKNYSSSIQNIQNVNISINNQINISEKQIKELISFYNNKKDNHNTNINLKKSKSFLNNNKNLIEKKIEGNKMSNQRNNYNNSFKSFTFIKENKGRNIIKSNGSVIHNLKLFYNSKTKKPNKQYQI